MTNSVDIHIFSPGTQTSAQGVTREFTKSDLRQVADSYNSSIHEAPIRIGHEDSDKVPSWGWVKNVKLKGEDLYAEVEFSPLMQDYVQNGLYKKVSASFYAPESKINPDPGQWSLRHVAMLGAQPPAVKGLKGFAYAEESEHEGVLDFAAEMKLSPEQVFDEELGPTLKSEKQPLEYLKDQLEEARTEMAAEEKEKAEAQATLEEMDMDDAASEEGAEFAEEDKKVDPKKKKAPAGEQGAEDAEEEEEGEDTMDNGELPEALKKNMKKKKGEEEDTSDNKEKTDPVGKEDGDIDNDGDSDSSDEYLKKRRAAIKKSMKEDSSDNGEMKYAGCDGARKYMEKYDEAKHGDMSKYKSEYSDQGEMKKYMEMKKKDSADHSEISVPEGMDASQWEAGFKDAVDKFYAGVEAGADEVLHQETEDQSADYLAGIEAGFEFAQTRLNRIGSDGIGSPSHDQKANDSDEVVDGEGPVSSKVKKQKTGEPESTVEKENNFGEVQKRGKDGLMSSDINENSEEEEDESLHAETGKSAIKAVDNDNGRAQLGKAKSSDSSNRKQKGTGKKGEHDDEAFNAKGTAPEEDRAKKGVGTPANRKSKGTAKDVQSAPGTEFKSLGNGNGSGKAIKSPAVRVLKFSEAQFSELSERLEQLEAMNQKLVAEKQAAEAKAHRMQLEEFAESLYATGRLTEATIEQEELVDYMEGLENGTLEFSEGETPATKLMDLLASLPQQVSFSEIAPHNVDEMPEADLDPHERALRLSKEGEMSYAEALKQTLFSAE